MRETYSSLKRSLSLIRDIKLRDYLYKSQEAKQNISLELLKSVK